MHDSVWDSDSFASIGVGTDRGGNSETHAFDTISVQSVQNYELFHVTAQVLYKQGSKVVVS